MSPTVGGTGGAGGAECGGTGGHQSCHSVWQLRGVPDDVARSSTSVSDTLILLQDNSGSRSVYIINN